MFEPKIDISDDTLKKKILNSLPAFKNSQDDSNNQKILNIIVSLFNNGKNNLLNVQNLMKLDNATGQNLTDWGKDYGVERFDDDDDFLRFEIRWQMLKSNTKLDMSSIKTLISVLLNIPLTQFDVVKTNRVKEVEITNIPLNFDSGSHSELKRRILSDRLQQVLPAETNLKDIQYQKQSFGQLYLATAGNKTVMRESEVI